MMQWLCRSSRLPSWIASDNNEQSQENPLFDFFNEGGEEKDSTNDSLTNSISQHSRGRHWHPILSRSLEKSKSLAGQEQLI